MVNFSALKKQALWMSVLSMVVLTPSCGRSAVNQAAPLPLANPTYSAPVPETQALPANGATTSASAIPGGRAVATAGGYVYEQDPIAQNQAYGYYNQQNPCLFPQPGQQGCAGQGGTQGYYQGPQQATGAYPQYNQGQYVNGQYPAGATAYPNAQTYPQTYPQSVAQPAYAQSYPTQQGNVAYPQTPVQQPLPNYAAQQRQMPATAGGYVGAPTYNNYSVPAQRSSASRNVNSQSSAVSTQRTVSQPRSTSSTQSRKTSSF